MSTTNPLSRLLLLYCLSASWAIALAQGENGPTETTGSNSNPTASSTYNVFSAIASASSRNGATGSTDDPRTPQDANDAGASGADNGGLSLSTGAIVAIAVVAGAAVIIGIGSAILFYLAKKREWKLRERMRRSARKVAAALTPKSATFNRSELPFNTKDRKSRAPKQSKKGMVRIDPPSFQSSFTGEDRGRNNTPPPAKRESPSDRSRNSSRESGNLEGGNLEKGLGTHTRIEAVKRSNQQPPQQSPGTPPTSRFDMDSPVEERGKGWSRIFGKR